MNKTTKIILIVIGSLMLVCICAVSALSVTGLWSFTQVAKWAKTNTTRDLYEVASMVNEIATITLPDGFGSPYGMHIGEITSVGFASRSRNTHILLTQFPAGTIMNTEEMLNLISQYSANPDHSGNSSNLQVIEGKPVTIRDQDAYLEISEGTSSDGTTYRTAVATFEGKGGPAMVMITGPLEEWDMTMIDSFIASMQ